VEAFFPLRVATTATGPNARCASRAQKSARRASANRAPKHGGGSGGVLSSTSDDDGDGSQRAMREPGTKTGACYLDVKIVF
jgi:hypothetical protein